MIGISIGSMIGNNVGSVLTGFITPVAALPPVDIMAALGALICGVSGVVLVRVLGNPPRSVSARPALEKEQMNVTAGSKVVRLADFRKAA